MLVVLVIVGILSEPQGWLHTPTALTTITLSKEGQVMASANSTSTHTDRKTQEWIRKARAKHGDRFGYDRVVYTHSNDKVEIYCPECGEHFWQRAAGHLQGDGCKRCGRRKAANAMAKSRRIGESDYFDRCREQHGTKYDYSQAKHKNGRSKIVIGCPEHGLFKQGAREHMNGHGCPVCSREEKAKNQVVPESEFWSRVKKAHPNSRYDYSKVKYERFTSRITIGCPKHGFFTQKAQNHAMGQGCRRCGVEQRALVRAKEAAEKFESEAVEKHGQGTYLYHLVEYRTSKHKVKIVCPVHGVFKKTPNDHLRGSGCGKCFEDRRGENRRMSVEDFVRICSERHSNKYDYSRVEQWNHGTQEKVVIGCPEHGWFEQRPQGHLAGAGCNECANIAVGLACRKGQDEFLADAIRVHGEGRYDYSLAKYQGFEKKVTIICPMHGQFRQTPHMHVGDKNGCPSCSESKGETKIRIFLDEHNIEYIREARFKWCRRIHPLRFDFHIWGTKLLVEFDGEQHFRARGKLYWFNDKEQLTLNQLRDRIKDESCLREGWDLLRIPYTEIDRIEDVIRPALRRHGFNV